jgi:hypothetical protein
MSGVVVDSVTIDGDIVDDTSTWRVTGLQQSRGGRWLAVDRRHPAFGQAGGTLRMRALLENGAGVTSVPLAVALPARAERTSGELFVGGGASSWFNAGKADTVAELQRGLSNATSNDAVEVQFMLEGRRRMVHGRGVSHPTDKVVIGHRLAALLVR